MGLVTEFRLIRTCCCVASAATEYVDLGELKLIRHDARPTMVRIGYKERKGIMTTLTGTGGRESKLLLSSSSIKERVSRMNTTTRALVD